MDNMPEVIRELRPHASWDLVREGVKLMLPFLAGLGIREWVHAHATALMWTAAIVVAVGIAFWDRIATRKSRQALPIPQAEAGSNLSQTAKPIASPEPNAAGPIGLALNAQLGTLTIDITNGPAVMCNYQFTTQGEGRREFEPKFRVAALKFFLPEIVHIPRAGFPRELNTTDGRLTVAMDGNKIILDDHGSTVLVDVLVLSEIPYRPEPTNADQPIAEAEFTMYQKIRSDFMSLSFPQKWAMRKILQTPGIKFDHLCMELDLMGFKDSRAIPLQVMDKGLVEQRRDTGVVPSSWAVRFADKLFREFPLS